MDKYLDIKSNNSPNNRSLRINKSCQNEYISSDYSTPKTTRTSVTRPTRGCRNLRNSKYHLLYKPLELDNESSSESTDSILRRRKLATSPQDVSKTPLAIKARPKSKSTETFRYKKQSIYEPEIILTIQDSDENKTKLVRKTPEVKGRNVKRQKLEVSPLPIKATGIEEVSRPLAKKIQDRKNQIEIIDLSQCMTPPITPEKVEEEEINESPKLPTFVPGSCDIQEVMRVYGSSIKKKSEANNKIQKKSEV